MDSSNSVSKDTSLRLSVVMATYFGDNPDWLMSAGESVFTQTRKPDELIIVLDGEVDFEHHQVLKRLSLFGKVVVIELKKNVGPGLARHRGVLASSSEVIAIMDADDICRHDRFENQLAILSAGSSDIVGSWISEFEVFPEDTVELRKVPEKHEEISAFAKKRSPMNNVTAMFFKAAYLKAGGYGDMRANEDYDLYVRMILTGARFYNIQKVLVDVRGGANMWSRRGGLTKVPDDIRMFFTMYRNDFIGLFQTIFNIVARIFIRILSNNLRKSFYQRFLRD
ncbi:glycosyltransferase [Alphaproteobacteria bacterium]|nr:glycosyltransferase [Alphaproteobacteria bacterium]